MVAVIFRMLSALRVFDVVHVMTGSLPATKTMSILARENMIEFDRFAYGSAQSTLLFFIIAFCVVLVIQVGRVRIEGDPR